MSARPTSPAARSSSAPGSSPGERGRGGCGPLLPDQGSQDGVEIRDVRAERGDGVRTRAALAAGKDTTLAWSTTRRASGARVSRRAEINAWREAGAAVDLSPVTSDGQTIYQIPNRLWRVEPRLSFSKVKFPEWPTWRESGDFIMRNWDLAVHEDRRRV